MPSDKQIRKMQDRIARKAPQLKAGMNIQDRLKASWYFDSFGEKIMLIAGQLALIYVIFWLILPKIVGFFSK